MNCFSYKLNLLKLQRKRDKESKILLKAVNVARKQGGMAAENEAYHSERYELDLIDAEIACLSTCYHISVAEKMALPTPTLSTESDLWEKSDYTGKWYLSNNGIAEIRRSIRTERKEKRENFGFWATMLTTMLIGVIGAVTGLIAVLKY